MQGQEEIVSRYLVPIVALLFACGDAQFSASQDLDSSAEKLDKSNARVDSSAEESVVASTIDPEESAAANAMAKGEGEVDVFNIGTVDRKLDILIVVDNSTTMNNANTQLSDKIAPLISKIHASDWQIAITTSTITDCLRGVLTKGKNDLAEFKEIVSKVHSKYLSSADRFSSNDEQVVKMATRALKGMPLAKNAGKNIDIDCSGEKQHWVRANSMLVVMMISDEDAADPTHQPENRCEQLSCIDAFYKHLSTIRVPHVSAKVYGILDNRANYNNKSHPSFNKNILYLQWRDPQENLPLFDYHHALYYNRTNTLNNLSGVLRKISTNISSALQNVFVLTNTYDEDEIIVTLTKTDGSTEEIDGFILENNTLVIAPDQLSGGKSITVQGQ